MTKRYGRIADKPPCCAHGASWPADHRLDRSPPPETQIPVFDPATLKSDYCESNRLRVRQ